MWWWPGMRSTLNTTTKSKPQLSKTACTFPKLFPLMRWNAGCVDVTDQIPNAQDLARQVKQAIRSVGETLRCSVGLAPNRFLAKIASNMKKPDGLVTLTASQLPQILFSLKPRDLPGIGHRMEKRSA